MANAIARSIAIRSAVLIFPLPCFWLDLVRLDGGKLVRALPQVRGLI
jgi:hypothetical protein